MQDATSTQDGAGGLLRDMRRAAGISQTELARVLGVTSGHLSHVEAGRRTLTRDALHKAAAYLASVTRGDAA